MKTASKTHFLKFFVFSFISLILIQTQAQKITSHSEGILSPQHDLSLQKFRDLYFYDAQGKIDLAKLQSLKVFLTQQRSTLEDSARLNKKTNLIEVHGADADKATKEGLQALGSEAETLAPTLFALEYVDDLIKNHIRYPPSLLHEKVELTLLWLAASYTIYPENILTKVHHGLENLSENFFEFDKNDAGKIQASNLLKANSPGFASAQDLKNLVKSGFDISRLDPPSGAFWTNNDIESYDPNNETFEGQKIFPDKSISVPTLHYKRMGNGTIKFKTDWYDSSVPGKKPQKKSITLRVGVESYTQSVVNQFARVLGYPATPSTFRRRVKLELGDVSLEEFLSQWKRSHLLVQGSAMTHMERIPGQNAVYLKNVTLEAYLDDQDYRKIGPFRMGNNGFKNRREYRAMVLYNALISLQDHAGYQSRVDGIRDPSTNLWNPLFFISDTSSALGLPGFLGNVGTVNEFTWEFTKVLNNKVFLFWLSEFDYRTWEDATYSDAKWLSRRIARISSSQIENILRNSGFPVPVQDLYIEKFKSRINKMILDFDLQKEGFRLHSVKSKKDLNTLHPQYINENAYLKQEAQTIPGNTLPILGNKMTPYQSVVVGALKTLQNRFLDFVSTGLTWNHSKLIENNSFDLGKVQTSQGLLFSAQRDVSVNPEGGPGQNRYLLKDTLSVSVPLGFNNERLTTPVAFYYTFKFQYFHSVTRMEDVLKSRFFSIMNPFALSDIKKNLKTGEQLTITHGCGASIGTTKLKILDDLKLEASLLGFSKDRIKTLYFSKPSNDLLEMAVDIKNSLGFQNGFNAKAVASLGIMMGSRDLESPYRLYRLDLLNQDPVQQNLLNKAFDQALVEQNFTDLDRLVKPLALDEKAKSRFFNLNLLFWGLQTGSSVHTLDINQEKIFVAQDSKSEDRAFDRIWNEKLDPKATKSVVNYLGNFWNEGEALEINFEGQAEKDLSNFKDLELKILISKVDSYCTRKEFEGDFKNFFNSKSGQKNYINFVMPEGLNAYPELVGQMKWQISGPALQRILNAATDWENLKHLEPDHRNVENFPMQDPREVVSYKASRILKALGAELSATQKEKLLREKAQDIVFVVKALIGAEGQRVAVLRKWAADKEIWVTTSLTPVLDLSHPSFNSKKGDLFYAPEIGQFQGFSYLENFRRKNLLQPVLQY